MLNKISHIRKRSGDIDSFDAQKIHDVVKKASAAVGINNSRLTDTLTEEAVNLLNDKFHERSIPAVEEIQDVVEEVLITNKQIKTAKAYILYRDQHSRLRDVNKLINSEDLMDGYLQQADWRVKENSNMSFSRRLRTRSFVHGSLPEWEP